jgi:hemerythrin-like domain-containing protein
MMEAAPGAAPPEVRRWWFLSRMKSMQPHDLLGAIAPGFDEPLEMLSACHGRIEAQLETLAKLAAHVPVHGADTQAQQAAANVMRYFDTAGANHHQDEEADLFPLLARIASEEREAEIMLLIDELRAEHREMERGWQALREVLVRIARGERAGLAPDAFAALYRRHIAREENALLPYAASVLVAAQRASLGTSMAARRRVAPSQAAGG